MERRISSVVRAAVQPLAPDFSKFTGPKTRIDPAGSRTNAQGQAKSVIGHEGATMIKLGDKYVHLGTAWSTDQGRKGSYNLYYCTSDKITGPYGPRKFVGRFLGHGTPFSDRPRASRLAAPGASARRVAWRGNSTYGVR